MAGQCVSPDGFTTDLALADLGSDAVVADATPDQPPAVPHPKALPLPVLFCPPINEGIVTFFGSLKVHFWVDVALAKAKQGPLVVYWHSLNGNPLEAALALSAAEIAAIKAEGGIVAAPSPSSVAGIPTSPIWTSSDDLVLDEIVACVNQQFGIDDRRIHGLGVSAGGMHAAYASYSRASYLASVATASGGLWPLLAPPTSQAPANKLPVMILHGGLADVVSGFSMQSMSQAYLNDLKKTGHFAFICNHGGGHVVPTSGWAWRFFAAHPFGTAPSPWAQGLPAAIPTSLGCTL